MSSFPRHGKARSIKSGLRRQCPSCERANIFAGYLKLKPTCPRCAAPIGDIRADDFPPYLTILIVGHIVVPLLVLVEINFHPSTLFQMIFWPAIALTLALTLLPILKGAVVGFMWSIDMKGDEQY